MGTTNKIDSVSEKLSEQQTKLINKVDFSVIPNSDEFQKIKIKPKNRSFNMLVTIFVFTISICIGIILGIIIYHFI